MIIYKQNKKDLGLKRIPIFKLFLGVICVLIIISMILNTYVITKISKDKSILISEIDTVYEEVTNLDLRREFLFDKYKAKNKEAFYYSIRASSSKLHIPPEWLLYMLYQESCFDHTAKNPNATAVGIGQMTKDACETSNVNYDNYKNADVYQQLLMIEKYLFLKKNGFNNYGELYLYLYLPSYINKQNTFKIPNKYLKINSGYARYNTLGKFKAGVTSKFQKELKKY